MQKIKEKLIAICFSIALIVMIMPQNVGAGIVEQPYLIFDDDDNQANAYTYFNLTEDEQPDQYEPTYNYTINFDLYHLNDGAIFFYHLHGTSLDENDNTNFMISLYIDGNFIYIYKWFIEATWSGGFYPNLDTVTEIIYFGGINETTNFNIEILYNIITESTNITLINDYSKITKTFETNIYKIESTYLEYIYLGTPIITTSGSPTTRGQFGDISKNNINGYDNIQYISRNKTDVEQLNYTIDFSEYSNPSNNSYYFSNNETIKDDNDNTILTFRISSPAVAYAGEYTARAGTTIIFNIWENNYIRYGIIILALLVGIGVLDLYIDSKPKNSKRRKK